MNFQHQLIKIILLTLVGFSKTTGAVQETTNIKSFAHYPENMVLRLIIQAYTDDIIHELQQHPNIDLTSTQEALLKERLSGLHDHIHNHPALHQNRLWVGQKKPTFAPDNNYFKNFEIELGRPETKHSEHQKFKRESFYPSEEICTTETTWLKINFTIDLYNKPVEIIQQDYFGQYVFSFRCLTLHKPCRGITTMYESECIERLGWVYMYYRRRGEKAQWGPVAVPSHCVCIITPRFFPDLRAGTQ
ncbi:uncharacterized protein LOC111087673 [Limulus polyphemus]|uniref:Uncharacterized protein LOC111087673 n=1 Tax=Limulus polyphemus TaxID=6850 RepID=A0ABM1T4M9_LIMPO|nr:uncharacterized protein LOC111087673 [Limulus polyphemus]